MTKPLVVYSKPDLPHTSELMRHSDLLDFAELDSVPSNNWPVAYMRCAHYTWTSELELASKVEEKLLLNKTKIINSVKNRIRCQRKDYYYPILQREGIPIPTFVHHPTIHEIRYMLMNGLSWPFIHRSTDGSKGRDAFLVHNEEEFILADNTLKEKGRRRISVEFINSKNHGEYFIRRRAFIIFGEIDMWISDISPTWNTQSDSGKIEDFICENKTFSPSDKICKDVIAVGKTLGLDIYAVDIIPDAISGIHYIVDVNPTYRFICPGIQGADGRGTLPCKMQEKFNGHHRRIASHLNNQAKINM